MAIKKLYVINICGQEVFFQNAYCKINKQDGTKELVCFDVDFFTQKDGEKINSLVYQFCPDMDGGNFIKQAYEHLKTLPEFEGAIDC